MGLINLLNDDVGNFKFYTGKGYTGNGAEPGMKSLKFGKDRPGGGDSGQPYIKNPILDNIVPESEDFLLRGGLNAPFDAAQDVARLTKYMFDLKSPSGLLFTAKQNLLSRVAPKTEASKGVGYAGGALNSGVYTPLSTLAQAGVGFAGIHLNKQGLDPTGLIDALSIKKYEDVIKSQDENRLVALSLYSLKNFNKIEGYDLNQGQDIITYDGGPGSTLGIGKTHIRYADQRTGVNNPLSDSDPKYFYKGGVKLHKEEEQNIILGTDETGRSIITYGLGASVKQNLNDSQIGITENGTYNISTQGGNPYNYALPYSTLSKNSLGLTLSGSNGYQSNRISALINNGSGSAKYVSPINQKLYNTGVDSRQLIKDPVYRLEQGTFIPQNIDNTDLKGASYSSENTLKRDYSDDAISGSEGYLWKDFNNGSITHKKGYLADLDKNAGSYLKNGELVYFNNGYPGGIAPDFRLTPRDKRGLPPLNIHNQNPERTENIKGYDSGVGETYSRWITDNGNLETVSTSSEYRYKAIDTIYYDSSIANINRSSFRKSNQLDDHGGNTDLIRFRFEIISPTSSSKQTPLTFRAYIDDFSDSYTADWKSQTYMGRAEKFYKYNSFDRSISLGFTIVADNEDNLITMYNQLNTLAASLAPTYTEYGYMTGNLHKLTVGNYVSGQVGIMSGLTYEVTDESPWEIKEGSQLPLYIKVTGIKFTPIHDFRPESQFNKIHPYIKQ